jgi:hypothetical protein
LPLWAPVLPTFLHHSLFSRYKAARRMRTGGNAQFGGRWWLLVASGPFPGLHGYPFSCGSDISRFLLGLAPRSRSRGENSIFGHEKSRKVTFGHLCPPAPHPLALFRMFRGHPVWRPAKASLPGPSSPPPSCVQRISRLLGDHQTEGGSRRQGPSPKMTNLENFIFGHEKSRNVTFGHLCPPAPHPLAWFRMFRGHPVWRPADLPRLEKFTFW